LEIVTYIELLSEMIKREKPQIIVVADDVTALGRAACHVGRKYNIPSLTVQPGLLIDSPMLYDLASDHMALQGRKDLDYFLRKGEKRSKFTITGQPRYDILATHRYDRRKTLFRLGLNPNLKTGVLTTQDVHSDINQEVVKIVCEASSRFENLQMIIKPHPYENFSPYKKNKYIRTYGARLVKDINIFELLHACDFNITISSTTGIEALILGKPVIILDYPKGTNPEKIYMDSKYSELFPKAHNGQTLIDAINKVLCDDNYKRKFKCLKNKFLEYIIYKVDGKSTERVVNLIKRLKKPIR